MAATDEFGLIARYFAPLAAGEPGALDLLDDAAVLALPADRALVVTTDMMVEGVHFRADDPPPSIGVKLLAVNLSDLAAMGAEPRAYLLATAFPKAWPCEQLHRWIEGFVQGLAMAQRRHGIVLAGGDTVSTAGPLSLALTALGLVAPGGALRRGGATVGDLVYVSGTIGDGALGMRVLSGDLRGLAPAQEAMVIDRYRQPEPRLALGCRLRGVASACADVSDGLIADLGHICRTSGVAARIRAAQVPLSAAGRAACAQQPGLLTALLAGGDDYELVFTAPADEGQTIAMIAEAAGVPVNAIGEIVETKASANTQPVDVIDANGVPLSITHSGWRHF